MVQLICPACKVPLEYNNEQYLCKPCQEHYGIRNGIVSFNETNHYYGKLPQDEMEEFLRLSEVYGWKEAVSDYLPKKNPGLRRTITGPRRTALLSLLNLKRTKMALDFGCGLGGVSILLAESVDDVVALDGCYDRIQFLQIRKDQDKLHNISLVCNSRAHELPFPDASFDLIILNMVFPYLAVTLPEYDIVTAEKIIPREITRILKPGGEIYISVRNKYCFHRLKNIVFPFGVAPKADNFNAHGYGINYCRHQA